MTKEELIQALTKASFRYAKTMPRFPHWYTLKTTWEKKREFNAAVVAVRKYGEARRFFKRTFTYFDHGDYTYWTMGSPVRKTLLINRARRPDAD